MRLTNHIAELEQVIKEALQLKSLMTTNHLENRVNKIIMELHTRIEALQDDDEALCFLETSLYKLGYEKENG